MTQPTDNPTPGTEPRERLQRERDQLLQQHEALADVARAISGSLRLDDVMHLSLGYAIALLHAGGATLGLLRDGNISVVAGRGAGEILIGATLPLGKSISGRAVREQHTVICN